MTQETIFTSNIDNTDVKGKNAASILCSNLMENNFYHEGKVFDYDVACLII